MKADKIELNKSHLPTAPCLCNPTVFHTLINKSKTTGRHSQGPEHVCFLWGAWLEASLGTVQLSGPESGSLGDRAEGASLGSYVWAWPSHTTVPYKLETNLDCTLIIYEWFLPPKPYPSVKNSFVRFSYLEKPVVRLSEMDKLLSIGKRW